MFLENLLLETPMEGFFRPSQGLFCSKLLNPLRDLLINQYHVFHFESVSRWRIDSSITALH